jgi:hypothetical protein
MSIKIHDNSAHICLHCKSPLKHKVVTFPPDDYTGLRTVKLITMHGICSLINNEKLRCERKLKKAKADMLRAEFIHFVSERSTDPSRLPNDH